MSVVPINDNYVIDNNEVGDNLCYISSSLSNNINITLPDCSNYQDGLYYSFFNNDSTYNLNIIPYSGQSIIDGNIALSNLQHVNLISYNSQWYQI